MGHLHLNLNYCLAWPIFPTITSDRLQFLVRKRRRTILKSDTETYLSTNYFGPKSIDYSLMQTFQSHENLTPQMKAFNLRNITERQKQHRESIHPSLVEWMNTFTWTKQVPIWSLKCWQYPALLCFNFTFGMIKYLYCDSLERVAGNYWELHSCNVSDRNWLAECEVSHICKVIRIAGFQKLHSHTNG